MTAHDGRIFRVFFPTGPDGAVPRMHGVPVDAFRLSKWFPNVDIQLFFKYRLESLTLRKADGREIRIEMDQKVLQGGANDQHQNQVYTGPSVSVPNLLGKT